MSDFLAQLEERIVRIPEAGCWLWTGASNRGYGYVTVEGKKTKAHRVVYGAVHGGIPNGLQVLHRCDVPCCVNPYHLFAGTIKDNVQDCVAKGRHRAPNGERNGRAKLTADDVLAIRVSRLSSKELAPHYGISREKLHAARTGRTWVHLPSAEVLSALYRAAELAETT